MTKVELWLTKQPITARYGWRDLPGFGRNFHQGVDFAFSQGAPVSACGPGTVVEAGYHKVYGNYVKIDHGLGVATSYHSLASISVSRGQIVSMQQIVGGAGKSAQGATGPHLHLGLWLYGQHVDPLKYLAQGQVRLVRERADGSGAAASTRAIQLALNARNFKTVVDNVYGSQTKAQVLAYQRAIGLFPDGVAGPQTWPHLKVVEDGKPGAQTTRGAQAALGTAVDGNAGPVTDKLSQARWGFALSKATSDQLLELQKKLNQGTA